NVKSANVAALTKNGRRPRAANRFWKTEANEFERILKVTAARGANVGRLLWASSRRASENGGNKERNGESTFILLDETAAGRGRGKKEEEVKTASRRTRGGETRRRRPTANEGGGESEIDKDCGIKRF
ncbi:MAG: hypothetical protein IJO46_05765, partial [Thermoguttaceae bacterium]|nr:hypothetical protein [Thermoguttaceae bacterium]